MHKNTGALNQTLSDIKPFGLTPPPIPHIWRLPYNQKRYRALKNAYAGETAFILTCGPSLGEVWNDELEEFLSDKLVIAVKQAQYKSPDICDFHLYNEIRMEEYTYHPDTICLGVSRFMPKHAPHIHFPIKSYDWDDSLFLTKDFKNADLETQLVRPWGIGIMYELGLFLPLFLGCTKSVTIGFDMNKTGNYHFYDDKKSEDASFYKVDEEEFDHAADTAGEWDRWAKTHGHEARLYSPQSALPILKLKTLEEIKSFVCN